MWLEFGCYKGSSLALMAKAARQIRPASSTSVVGFDSFRGIPEAWIPGWEARALDLDGVATAKEMPTEDTITLAVQWQNLSDGSLGHGLYTSSWVAPKSDVHSQQRFFYMGQKGEINVDQAHRGYAELTGQLESVRPKRHG